MDAPVRILHPSVLPCLSGSGRAAAGRHVAIGRLQSGTDTPQCQCPCSGDQTAPGHGSTVTPLVVTEQFREFLPAISRDGRWLAYTSEETGRREVFVRPFPDVGGGKWQISTDGGEQPVWAHNGRELFFLKPVTSEVAVAEFSTTAESFQRGRVTVLFRGAEAYLDPTPYRRSYVTCPQERYHILC